MKKRFCVFALLLTVSVLFSACSLSELIPGIENTGDNPPASEKTDDVVEKLDENTEKLTHYDGKGRLVFTHIITYNDSGKIIHKTSYDETGAEQGSFDFTYNQNGDPLDSAWFFWDAGYLMKTEREYDENGRLFSIHNYGDESRSVEGNMTYIYYDENGRKESDIYYSAWYENGSHCEAVYEYFTYNGTGKLDRVDRKSEAGETVDYTIYEYDAQGMNCTRTCYLPDGTIDYRYEYRYDENGKKTEQRRYDSKGNLVSINKY